MLKKINKKFLLFALFSCLMVGDFALGVDSSYVLADSEGSDSEERRKATAGVLTDPELKTSDSICRTSLSKEDFKGAVDKIPTGFTGKVHLFAEVTCDDRFFNTRFLKNTRLDEKLIPSYAEIIPYEVKDSEKNGYILRMRVIKPHENTYLSFLGKAYFSNTDDLKCFLKLSGFFAPLESYYPDHLSQAKKYGGVGQIPPESIYWDTSDRDNPSKKPKQTANVSCIVFDYAYAGSRNFASTWFLDDSSLKDFPKLEHICIFADSSKDVSTHGLIGNDAMRNKVSVVLTGSQVVITEENPETGPQVVTAENPEFYTLSEEEKQKLREKFPNASIIELNNPKVLTKDIRCDMISPVPTSKVSRGDDPSRPWILGGLASLCCASLVCLYLL